ncbi:MULTISPECIES: hypothetical protein [unclassified Streptomyces]|uniref:hypothetical protein n=1 Tax=Streptomyces sp. SID8367 TaxID=2690349 RepID=UPI0015EC5160|nr:MULTISPECIES: hypothetical protein [unclassified Streptomyces]
MIAVLQHPLEQGAGDAVDVVAVRGPALEHDFIGADGGEAVDRNADRLWRGDEALADKAYSSGPIRAYLRRRGIRHTIPEKGVVDLQIRHQPAPQTRHILRVDREMPERFAVLVQLVC